MISVNQRDDLIVCPICKQPFSEKSETSWRCAADGFEAALQAGSLILSPTPETAHVFEKVTRGPDQGTPWRQANWRFLESQVNKLPRDAILLDVGAGRGDFAPLLKNYKALALDIVNYPEIDLVCDLAELVPFREDTFDAVILMNVLEHVYPFQELLNALHYVLKPGGVLLLAVPFMIKAHQEPFDFYRFTHYALSKKAEEHGFNIDLLEGYYDAGFFIGEATRNVRFWYLPKMQRFPRWVARSILELMTGLTRLLVPLVGHGFVKVPAEAKNPAAIGYHLVLRKRRKTQQGERINA